VAAAVLAFGLVHSATGARAQSASADRWIGTWATAEVGRPQNPPPPGPALPRFMANRCPAPAAVSPAPPPPPPGQTFTTPPFYLQYTNQTLRQIVRTSIGGSKARVVFSNAYGTAPVTIGAAAIALRDKAGAIQSATSRPLTFSGRTTMTMPVN